MKFSQCKDVMMYGQKLNVFLQHFHKILTRDQLLSVITELTAIFYYVQLSISIFHRHCQITLQTLSWCDRDFNLTFSQKLKINHTLRDDWCTTFCIDMLAYTCVPNIAKKTKNPEKILKKSDCLALQIQSRGIELGFYQND